VETLDAFAGGSKPRVARPDDCVGGLDERVGCPDESPDPSNDLRRSARVSRR
jgi:hypothetical protein